eukprot:128960-Pyramimonas_sp.AAC.1
MAGWVSRGLSAVLVAGWSHRAVGAWGSLAFLGWRARRYLELGSWLSSACHAAEVGFDAFEDLHGLWLHSSGGGEGQGDNSD